jgi:hypothetical protein
MFNKSFSIFSPVGSILACALNRISKRCLASHSLLLVLFASATILELSKSTDDASKKMERQNDETSERAARNTHTSSSNRGKAEAASTAAAAAAAKEQNRSDESACHVWVSWSEAQSNEPSRGGRKKERERVEQKKKMVKTEEGGNSKEEQQQRASERSRAREAMTDKKGRINNTRTAFLTTGYP